MSKVTFGYWPVRGLGEPVKILLEYLKVPYEFKAYQPTDEDEWFVRDKPNVLQNNPAANLPYLKDGDAYICESAAIMVHLCLKNGKADMLGVGIAQQTTIATVNGVFKDLQSSYSRQMYENEGKTLAEIIPDIQKAFAAPIEKLDKLLQGRDFYAGKISFIDFVVANMTQVLHLMHTPLLDGKELLKAHQQRIWALP